MTTIEEEHRDKLRGAIALAGLPATMKTYAATMIGRWAKCPVLCIQHFLSSSPSLIDDGGDDDEKKKKKREEEVLQQGFATLCRVAKFHLSRRIDNHTVVVKSRLNSRFELDQLIELVAASIGPSGSESYPLLIIECRMTNEFQWKDYFESVVQANIEEIGLRLEKRCMEWYRHTSWKEMEDLIETSRDRQAEWDRHLQQLQLNASQQQDDEEEEVINRRLVVDLWSENLIGGETFGMATEFFDAIAFLLTAPEQELVDNFQSPYTIEFPVLRPYLLEKRLSAAEAKGRSNNPCPEGDCIFKYQESPIHDHVCRVCEELVTSRTPGYTCRLCILTMHKSCAERIDFEALPNLVLDKDMIFEFRSDKEERACKSCMDKGKSFSRKCDSCFFQKLVKCSPLPIVIHHKSHRHFLSMQLTKGYFVCTACGGVGRDIAYNCRQCALRYHLGCVLYPLQLLNHHHGGHVHEMNLKYSHRDDGMEHEESYWCDVCYKEMDPVYWCYSCPTCPYYVVHVGCAGGQEYITNVRDCIFVQQLQSQLEKIP